MNLYEKYLIPRLVNCICGMKPMTKQREKIIHEAKGVVLEIGIGSGHNLPFYHKSKVKYLIGVDPTPHKSALGERLDMLGVEYKMLFESAETLSVDNDSIDTIVTTYTMCTIPRIDQTVQEFKRVLNRGGSVIFIEHGLSPDKNIQKTQNRINPIWKRISGGCHLNRDIPQIFSRNGFTISRIDSMYLPGWKPSTWNWWGKAVVSG